MPEDMKAMKPKSKRLEPITDELTGTTGMRPHLFRTNLSQSSAQIYHNLLHMVLEELYNATRPWMDSWHRHFHTHVWFIQTSMNATSYGRILKLTARNM
uniref:Uncharacterized protein n=1 Tax=Arundo donax TaxID=35708 RepID=A0A0A9DKP4_ARUDO